MISLGSHSIRWQRTEIARLIPLEQSASVPYIHIKHSAYPFTIGGSTRSNDPIIHPKVVVIHYSDNKGGDSLAGGSSLLVLDTEEADPDNSDDERWTEVSRRQPSLTKT